MANKELVTVLTVKTEQSTNTIKGLKQEIASLKQTLENTTIGTDEFQQASKELATAQANLKTAIQDGKASTDNLNGSYNHLVATMAELKKQWRATADEATRTSIGEQIADINAQLKEMDSSIGNFQRNVGDYANSFKDALNEQQESTEKVRLGLDGLQKTASGLASGYSALQGIMALSNIENEKFEKLMIKVQSAMAIAQGVGGLKDLIEGFGTLKTVFGTATTACGTFIKGLNGVKLAIASTGIGLLVVAIGTLVAYWDNLTESVKKWTDAVEEGSSSFDKLLTKQGYLSNEALKRQKELNREIKIMQAEEKGDIEINEKRLELNKQIYEEQSKYISELKRRKHSTEFNISVGIGDKDKQEKELAELEKQIDEATKILDGYYQDIKDSETEVKVAVINAENEKNKTKAQAQKQAIEDKKQADAKAKSQAEQDKQDSIRKEKEATEKRLQTQEREITTWEKNERRKLQIKQEMAKEFEEYNSVELDGNGDGWFEESELEAYKEFLDQKKTLYEQNINAENAILQSQIIKLQELADAQALANEDNYSTLAQIQELNWQIEDNNKNIVKNTQYTNKEKAKADKDYIENSKKQEKLLADYKINIASNVMGAMVQLLGEESEAGKAFAVAQATIDTYQAANSAYKAMAGIPIVGPALGATAAATAVIAGIANVKKILTVDKDNPNVSTNGTMAMATPNVNIGDSLPVQYSRQLLSDTETENLNKEQKVVVVESDITRTQRKVSVAEKNSSF